MIDKGEQKKRVGLREVARRAGVSTGTVSSVFAGKSWVSNETYAAVSKAAEELGYLPRPLRRQPQQKVVTTLGLIVRYMEPPLPLNPYYAGILHGVEQICSTRGISLMYAIVDEDVEQMEDLPVMLKREQVQGLLVVGYFTTKFFALLRHLKIPFVLVDHSVEGLCADTINSDDEMGGYLATRHLLQRGVTRPAFIAGPLKYVSIRNRLRGYRRALAEHTIPYEETYVRWGNIDIASGLNEMGALLNLEPPPEAVFCANDLTALGALRTLSERGMRVPEDCALVGYDDIDLAQHASPPLTTVKTDTELLGQQGVWHLLERIAYPDMLPRHTLIGVKFIERRTS